MVSIVSEETNREEKQVPARTHSNMWRARDHS